MADWRQIQARIRKAKGATDAPVKLAELYERTRDAMVAFELAQFQEKAGEHAEAAKWYTAAAERFRRAQWRTKAEEALTRLGAPIPPPLPASASTTKTADASPEEETSSVPTDSHSTSLPEESAAEHPEQDAEETAVPLTATSPEGEVTAPGEPLDKKRRRRGRRGGRGRRRTPRTGEASASRAAAPAETVSKEASPAPTFISEVPARSVPVRREPESRPQIHSEAEHRPQPRPETRPERSQSPESTPAPSWHGRSSRAGEPALASRIAQLESQLRRLLACAQSSLDEADQAPAGPGVLLLSDSDQVTHYYIEACQTLRIGVGNLLRGGRGSRDSGRLKELMAENLGIPEAKISKYMKDHCAVRWLQLDEGAPQLAHFATAVLRPVANE